MKQSGRLFQPEPRNSKAKLSSQVIVRTKHIHSNDFHLTTNSSIVSKKLISDNSLCPAFKNSYDIKFVKILRNETHLHLPIATVTPLTVSTSQDIISGSRLKSCLKWKSLSFRITVEVEMDSWWAISVIDVFSINFWAIFWLIIRGIWWFFLDERCFGDHHFRTLIALETAFSKENSSRHVSRFRVRNLRRFLKVIFLHLTCNQDKMESHNPV